jgi:hypothetical protein
MDPVPAANVRGEVWFHVPYLGSIRDFLNTGFGRIAVVSFALLLLIGYAAAQLVKTIRQKPAPRDSEDRDEIVSVIVAADAFHTTSARSVANLLGAEYHEAGSGRVALAFSGSPERVHAFRALLAPFLLSDSIVETSRRASESLRFNAFARGDESGRGADAEATSGHRRARRFRRRSGALATHEADRPKALAGSPDV